MKRIIPFIKKPLNFLNKIYPKLNAPEDSPIIIVTAQKSGTHLLKIILNKLGLKQIHKHDSSSIRVTVSDIENIKKFEYLHTHQAPDRKVYDLIELNKVKVIFNYRDPRDVVVSNYFWQSKENKHFNKGDYAREFKKKAYDGLVSKEAVLRFMINCNIMHPEEQTLIDWFYETRGLLHHPGVLKTNYEKLVGSKGGGSDLEQRKMISEIKEFLDLKKQDVNAVAKKAYDPSQVTFRKGKIGDYKNHMNKELLNLFEKKHVEILNEYGYK